MYRKICVNVIVYTKIKQGIALEATGQQNADETVAVTAQVSDGTAQQEQNVAAKKIGYATANVNEGSGRFTNLLQNRVMKRK